MNADEKANKKYLIGLTFFMMFMFIVASTMAMVFEFKYNALKDDALRSEVCGENFTNVKEIYSDKWNEVVVGYACCNKRTVTFFDTTKGHVSKERIKTCEFRGVE